MTATVRPRQGAWACALLWSVLQAAPAAAAPLQTPSEASPDSGSVPEYTISAGDVLQVVVWKEPELTRDLAVRVDGRITMPLIGDVDAGGRTPQEVSRELTTRLGRFLEAPVVSVALSQANSARVFVIGQVRTPGGFPFASRMTVLQALALAGGFVEFAKTDRILVIREGSQSSAIQVNYKKLETGDDLAQNVLLQAGDTVLVP